MKRILLLTAIAVSALTACHKAETTISFNLTDLPEGTFIEIYKMEGRGGESVFTDSIQNGTFCYTYVCDSFNINTYYGVEVSIGDTYLNRDVYISPNTNSSVSGSGFYADKWTVTSENPHQLFINSMNDASGSVWTEIVMLNAELNNSEKTEEERQMLAQKRDSLNAVYDELRYSAMETYPVDEYWMEWFEMMTAAVRHSGSAHPKYQRMIKLYNCLSETDKATPAGKRITMNLFGKAPAIGDNYIDSDLYDVEGNVHRLAEYQGKWILLEFSSYYCGPCRAFTPVINRLYERGVGQKFEIVTVTSDTKNQFEEMAASDKGTNPLWNDRNSDLFSLYKVSAWPTFYLISPDGKITETWQGLDMQRILKIIGAYAQPEPEFKTENGVKIITKPTFSSVSHLLFVDNVELYSDSTVLNCTYVGTAGSYCISSDSYLSVNSKRVSTITKADVEMDKFIQVSPDEVGHCRLTFEPLPQSATEFDFIESDCPTCFRVLGIKIK